MTKGVASLVDYQEQALACNRLYLDTLAVVDDPAPAYPELGNSPGPKLSTAAATRASTPRGATMCDSSGRSWTATTSQVAFATATSVNHCSGDF
jgi:hypothetical protein